jgi:2-haloacid dehalogenase
VAADPRTVAVFDLGGVLVDWNPRYLYLKLFGGDEAKVAWFLTEVCNKAWNDRHDRGVPFDENMKELIRRYPEHESHIRAYKERWTEMFGGPIDGSVRILTELRAGKIPTYALSNWSAETFPIARRLFPFLRDFDGTVISGEIGVSKPDPAIFEHLLSKYRFSARDAVFVDDLAANVEAANRLGFQGIHFRDPESLRADLAATGLLPRCANDGSDQVPLAQETALSNRVERNLSK